MPETSIQRARSGGNRTHSAQISRKSAEFRECPAGKEYRWKKHDHATFFAPSTPADMDVRCNRCDTEYEFDDALISERGTTVKCTNCGFQFKIYPGKGTGLAPERWVVRTASGRELVYTSLRELQRGIADKKVVASDLLSRGKQTPRPLGSIAELEPFFQVTNTSSVAQIRIRRARPAHAARRRAAAGRVSRVPQRPTARARPDLVSATRLASLAATAAARSRSQARSATASAGDASVARHCAAVRRGRSSRSGSELTPDTELMSQPMALEDSAVFQTPPADLADEPRTTLPHGSPAKVATRAQSQPGVVNGSAKTRTVTDSVPDSGSSSFVGTPLSSRVATFDTTLEVPVHAPVSSPRNLPPIEVANIRDSFKSYDELRTDSSAEDEHARVARSRWIAGVVVVGVLGLLGATVGRRYIAQLIGTATVNTTERCARREVPERRSAPGRRRRLRGRQGRVRQGHRAGGKRSCGADCARATRNAARGCFMAQAANHRSQLDRSGAGHLS